MAVDGRSLARAPWSASVVLEAEVLRDLGLGAVIMIVLLPPPFVLRVHLDGKLPLNGISVQLGTWGVLEVLVEFGVVLPFRGDSTVAFRTIVDDPIGRITVLGSWPLGGVLSRGPTRPMEAGRPRGGPV